MVVLRFLNHIGRRKCAHRIASLLEAPLRQFTDLGLIFDNKNELLHERVLILSPGNLRTRHDIRPALRNKEARQIVAMPRDRGHTATSLRLDLVRRERKTTEDHWPIPFGFVVGALLCYGSVTSR